MIPVRIRLVSIRSSDDHSIGGSWPECDPPSAFGGGNPSAGHGVRARGQRCSPRSVTCLAVSVSPLRPRHQIIALPPREDFHRNFGGTTESFEPDSLNSVPADSLNQYGPHGIQSRSLALPPGRRGAARRSGSIDFCVAGHLDAVPVSLFLAADTRRCLDLCMPFRRTA